MTRYEIAARPPCSLAEFHALMHRPGAFVAMEAVGDFPFFMWNNLCKLTLVEPADARGRTADHAPFQPRTRSALPDAGEVGVAVACEELVGVFGFPITQGDRVLALRASRHEEAGPCSEPDLSAAAALAAPLHSLFARAVNAPVAPASACSQSFRRRLHRILHRRKDRRTMTAPDLPAPSRGRSSFLGNRVPRRSLCQRLSLPRRLLCSVTSEKGLAPSTCLRRTMLQWMQRVRGR